MYRLTKWRVAALVGAVALGSIMPVATAGVAQAAQANQEWWGATDNAGDWIYLGNPSGGGNYYGNIHSVDAAPSKCLDADLNKLTFYQVMPAAISLWDCNGGFNQWWHQVDNGDGSWSYYVEDVNGNRSYLAVPAYSTQLFTNYELFGVSSDRERFTIGPNGQLQSVFNGQCVDLQNWQSSNGTPIQIYQCG